MDKYELRRLAFKRLVESKGRGGQAQIASETGIAPNYISRMLYPPGKKGRKNIGEDSADVLTARYPGWLDVDVCELDLGAFASRQRNRREAAIQEIVALLRTTNEEWIGTVAAVAKLEAERHPLINQQVSSQ